MSLCLFAPAVSAHHWGDEYQGPYSWTPVADSTCPVTDVSPTNAECLVGYLCTDGTPPQVVDTVLHCSSQAASHRSALVAWAPLYAWKTLDERSETVEEMPYQLNQTVLPQETMANGVLCGQVWSQFCSTPVWLPNDLPVSDPVRYYPL